MRLRAEYSVGPEMKFLSHLDMIRLMERALRRTDLPFALTEGFNPHIKLSMGTVLPVGLWGEREYFDIETTRSLEPQEFKNQLNEALPASVRIKQGMWLDSGGEASIMKIVNAASYVFLLNPGIFDLQAWVAELLSRESLPVCSRGKKKDQIKDLRPGIFKMIATSKDDFDMISVCVNAGEPVNVRYDELLALLLEQGLERNDIVDMYRSGNYYRIGTDFYSPLEKVR